MKKTMITCMVCFGMWGGIIPICWAGPMGTAYTYQGQLSDGDTPADGEYDFEFILFDDAIGTGQVGSTIVEENVTVDAGTFTVKLDFGSDVFTGDARWLEIGIRPGAETGAFTTHSPRQELTPTPYSLHTRGIYVSADENVGIGTSSPVWELEVANLMAGDGAESAVRADDASGAIAAYSSSLPAPFKHYGGRVSLFSDAATMGLDLRADGSTGDMRFYTGGPWSSNERMRITSNGGIRITSYRDDGLGSWEEGLYFANNSNGLGPWSHAGIWADGISGFNGELVFGVDGDDTNNLNGIQEVMRINRSGNVGIGTMYPGHRLHVSNIDATSGGVVRFSNNQDIYLDIGVSGSNTGWPVGNDNPYIFTENKDLVIFTGSGLVGIGTDSPGAKLDIEGIGDPLVMINHNGGVGNPAIWFKQDNKTKAYIWVNQYDGDLNLGNPTINPVMSLQQNGNVGIGTADPKAKLDVAGRTRTKVLEITGGGDLAEPFDIAGSESIKPGMVVAIDAEHPGQLRVADNAYDRTVAGCVSGANGINPGLTMRQEGTSVDGSLPVALSGRVYCRADASSGAIQPGDLLTTSDTPGHAMKAIDYTRAQGAILGKAMTSLQKGRGLVSVLVTLQ